MNVSEKFLNDLFTLNDVNTNFFDEVNPAKLNNVNNILADIFSDFEKLFETFGSRFSGGQDIQPGGWVSPPMIEESFHPPGSLTTDGNAITTPGGYKIEATGQFEWNITGPDGKSTRVWGDPHVDEGDGGKWDFKRNSTFVLGDGTKVNVTTAPYGNGATVTQGLEIISGNDRVTVSGIDKGRGVVGQVTQDGYAHANTFGGNDVFVMGGETDDWSFQGREIVGSRNGGESFKLGGRLAAGDTRRSSEYNFLSFLRDFSNFMSNNWNRNWRPNRFGTNPYYDGLSTRNDFRSNNNYDRSRHHNQMRQAFRLLGEMFHLLERMARLNDQLSVGRNRTMYA